MINPDRKEEDNFEPINHRVNTLDRGLVIRVIKKLPKNSATAIDGWNRDLIFSSVTIDPCIAEDLGIVLALLASSTQTKNKENETELHNKKKPNNNNNNNNNNKKKNDDYDDEENIPQLQQQQQKDEHEFFDNETMKFIRAARLLGIPKSDGGIRPIIISSFLAKLVGNCLLKRSGVSNIPYQYAINFANGSKIIGHIARKEFQNGKALIFLDICNGFKNSTVRKNILQQMKDDKICEDLQSYFCVLYSPPSHLLVYGPNGKVATIISDEGFVTRTAKNCKKLQITANN